MSDPGLQADLQLDITAALTAAADLETALTQAVTGLEVTADASAVTAAIDEAIAGAEATVPIDADTAAASAALDAVAAEADGLSANIPVDADTSAASAAIDGVAAEADSVSAEITVTADTSQAEDAISGLGDSAGGADASVSDLAGATEDLTAAADAGAGSTGGLGTAVGTLGNAASLTGGNVKGLGTAVATISPAAAPIVGTIGAVVGILGTFVAASSKSLEANTRLTSTFGPLEGAIRNIDIGTLNGDLEDLAGRLGTSDESLKNAASRIQTLGEASGAAAPQVEQTTEQILALALRTRALNPALGEAGDIANKLFTAFGKNGKGLAALGISLSTTEVNQRALNLAQERGADAATTYDKQVAAAQIATEKYGQSLATAFASGEANPAIQIAALREQFVNLTQELGAPLVVPAVGALSALLPVGAGVIQVVGGVAQALIPLLDLVKALGPAFGVIGAVLGLAGQALSLFANAANGAGLGVIALGVAMTGVLGPLGTIAAAAAGVGIILNSIFGKSPVDAAFQQGVKDAQKQLADTGQSVDDATAAFVRQQVEAGKAAGVIAHLGLSYEEFAKQVLAGSDSVDKLVTATRESAGDAIVASDSNKDLRDAITSAGGSMADFSAATAKGDDALRAYLESLGISGFRVAGLVGAVHDAGKSVKDLAAETNAAAKSQLDIEVNLGEVSKAYQAAGDATGNYAKALADGRLAADTEADATLGAAIAAGTLTQAQYDAAIAATTNAQGQTDASAALALVTAQQQASAEALLTLGAALDDTSTRLPNLVRQLQFTGDGIGNINTDLVNLVTQLSIAGVTSTDFGRAAQVLGVSVDSLHGFVDGVNDALGKFANDAVAKLPSVGSAFDAAADHAKTAKRDLSGQDIADALNASLKGIRDYTANLNKILSSGYADLAGLAAAQGPAAVAAIAKSLDDPNHTALNSIRQTFETDIPAAIEGAAPLVQAAAVPYITQVGITGSLAAQNFGTTFSIDQLTRLGFDAATAQVIASQGPLGAASAATGAQATLDYTGGIDGIDAATQVEMASAVGVVTGAAGPMGAAGAGTGAAATGGLQSGLSGVPAVATTAMGAAANAIHNAKDGITSAGASTGKAGAGAFSDPLKTGTAAGVKEALAGAGTNIGATLVLKGQAQTAGAGVGLSFGAGIVAGIDGYIPKIRAAAAASVRAAESAARTEAQSHSPSRLFQKVGQDLSAGLAQGVFDGAADVVAAAEDIVRQAAAAAGSATDALSESVRTNLTNLRPDLAVFNANGISTDQVLAAARAAMDQGLKDDLAPIISGSILEAIDQQNAGFTGTLNDLTALVAKNSDTSSRLTGPAGGTTLTFTVDQSGATFAAGTDAGQVAEIEAARAKSAVDTLRRNQAVVAAVMMQGSR